MTDRTRIGETASPRHAVGDVYELPAGHPHAGRLFRVAEAFSDGAVAGDVIGGRVGNVRLALEWIEVEGADLATMRRRRRGGCNGQG